VKLGSGYAAVLKK